MNLSRQFRRMYVGRIYAITGKGAYIRLLCAIRQDSESFQNLSFKNKNLLMELKPIVMENEHCLIHPYRPIDFSRNDQITNDLFQIYSDEETLTYIPHKRLNSMEDASNLLFAIINGYHHKMDYTHFITLKQFNKVIGVISIISPDRAKQVYRLNEYHWMIEYALVNFACGRGIMSESLRAIIHALNDQGINKIGAVTHKQNANSINVLMSVGFKKLSQFDLSQDYYVHAN